MLDFGLCFLVWVSCNLVLCGLLGLGLDWFNLTSSYLCLGLVGDCLFVALMIC